MRRHINIVGSTPQEKQIPVLPSGVAGVLVLASMALNGIMNPVESTAQDWILIAYAVFNSLYLINFHFILIPSPKLRASHIWRFAALQVIAGALITATFSNQIDNFLSGLMILLVISISIVSDRQPAFFLAVGLSGAIFFLNLAEMLVPSQFLRLSGSILIAIVSLEAIYQFKSLARRNINRLEIINKFSRQIASSLDTQQVLSLLGAAFQNSVDADTYFIGQVDGDSIKLELLYDDGEYFDNVSVEIENTLAGWVIKNQKDLFLPDLGREPEPSGVRTVVIGKEKTSLSWMGVPLRGQHINGVLAIASYRPNAFDRNDLELMNNMAQQAALALDNSIHHEEVEENARLDSLTGVYNHGYFLKLLRDKAEKASFEPITVIMLDVDYFKQYNDTYGHLAGDEILTLLCETIKGHIKNTDAVGRWGGEEFVIALPGASGKQAHQVAERIHASMSMLKIKGTGRHKIPSPTLSQGIAQFPDEADDIMKLIDLADRRLYIAKERGRNQIEPSEAHWEKSVPHHKKTRPSG